MRKVYIYNPDTGRLEWQKVEVNKIGTAAGADIGTGASDVRSNLQNDTRFIQGGSVVQGTGNSTTDVMSQKAVSDDLNDRLLAANNLNDLQNVPTARTNLGLKSAATRDVGESSGNVMEVGAFGIGNFSTPNTIADNKDIRELASGIYSLNKNHFQNIASDGAVLWVGMRVGTNSTFILHQASNNKMWISTKFSNKSGEISWVEIHHSGNLLASTGNSTEYPMSQKAVTDALNTKNTQGTDPNQTRTNSQNDARFVQGQAGVSGVQFRTNDQNDARFVRGQAGTSGGQFRTNDQNDTRFVQGQAGTGGGEFRTNTQNDSRFIQGGSVVQTTGTSATDVMSQDAVTSFVDRSFSDYSSFDAFTQFMDLGSSGSATVSMDLDLSFNFLLTLDGDATIGSPANKAPGKSGEIRIEVDGNRTLGWHTDWEFYGTMPDIGDDGDVWLVSYKVVDSSTIVATAMKKAD